MTPFPSQPPLLIFPDRAGGFLVFENPRAVFAGEELARAEAAARTGHHWLAGGLEYARAEGPAPGWWGVFDDPRSVTEGDLRAWADPGAVVTGELSSTQSFEDYEKAFATVRAALAEGITYQVNLTFRLEGRAVSGAPWTWRSALRLWLDLIAAQGREASFAAVRPDLTLISASPELFFQVEGGVVESRPMKGTALRHADPRLDAAARHELATSVKTRAENLMICDMIRNDLGRIAARGGVSVPRLFEIEEYPTVWQMTSTVSARVPEVSLTGLMEALFPCASITGAPKLSTQTVIAGAEPEPRGWYTGTLGWFRPASAVGGPARGRFSVLIRTLVADAEGRFRLGVGGGVVWDSTPQGEWEEAWAKARFLSSTRRTFSLTEAVVWTPEGGFACLEEHEARLEASAREFGGRVDPGALRAALKRAVHGRSPLKLRALLDPTFALRVEVEPLSAMADTLTYALAAAPLGPESLLRRRFKTSERAVYDQAKVAGADQTIHYNERGELTESTSMNLVLDLGGRLLTPALSCGLLGGTFRAKLLAEGRIEEAVLPVSSLEEAEAVWLINSVRGWKRALPMGVNDSASLDNASPF